MKLSLKKLNSLGIAHIIAPIVVVLAIGAIGTYTLVRSHAATPYACGSQCNGKAPTWVIPGNGIQCSKSATPHYQKTFKKGGQYVSATVYYSSVCQTMWAVTVGQFNPDAADLCKLKVARTISPTYSKTVTCANNYGTSGKYTSVMIDDHSATGGKAGTVSMSGSIENGAGDTMPTAFSFSY